MFDDDKTEETTDETPEEREADVKPPPVIVRLEALEMKGES